MNDDIISDLSLLYQKCLEEARKILINTPSQIGDEIDVANSLFIGYVDRTSSRYKGVDAQDEKGNNSNNPASEGQKGLIKTIVMEMGPQGESVMEECREMFGLKKRKDFAELNELKMGDAHLIIDKLKEAKKKK